MPWKGCWMDWWWSECNFKNPSPEIHIDNIDELLDYFEKGLSKPLTEKKVQRDFEEEFTNFFRMLQQSQSLTLTKEQLNRLHHLVEKFAETFAISSLQYRRTILNIPEKKQKAGCWESGTLCICVWGIPAKLFILFVLLAAAGWYRLMPPGGSFFWEGKTCNFWKLWYNHDTLGRDCNSAPG